MTPDKEFAHKSRPMVVKCWIGNLDERHQGLVIASSQKEAAKTARTGIKSFRDYWVLQTNPWPITAPKINTLYTRPFESRASDPFKEGRCEIPGDSK